MHVNTIVDYDFCLKETGAQPEKSKYADVYNYECILLTLSIYTYSFEQLTTAQYFCSKIFFSTRGPASFNQ